MHATEFCAKCKMIFEDSAGQPLNDKFYCTDCYKEIQAILCDMCHEPIEDIFVTVLRKQYHTKCFACAHCKKPFPGGEFVIKDGLAYCAVDYGELFVPKCAACNLPILESRLEAHGKWHCLSLSCDSEKIACTCALILLHRF